MNRSLVHSVLIKDYERADEGHILYCIEIYYAPVEQPQMWSIKRRYNDFKAFDRISAFKTQVKLPPSEWSKSLIKILTIGFDTGIDNSFLEKRIKGLQSYLDSLLITLNKDILLWCNPNVISFFSIPPALLMQFNEAIKLRSFNSNRITSAERWTSHYSEFALPLMDALEHSHSLYLRSLQNGSTSSIYLKALLRSSKETENSLVTLKKGLEDLATDSITSKHQLESLVHIYCGLSSRFECIRSKMPSLETKNSAKSSEHLREEVSPSEAASTMIDSICPRTQNKYRHQECSSLLTDQGAQNNPLLYNKCPSSIPIKTFGSMSVPTDSSQGLPSSSANTDDKMNNTIIGENEISKKQLLAMEDDRLEDLLGIVSRQKELGLAITAELGELFNHHLYECYIIYLSLSIL